MAELTVTYNVDHHVFLEFLTVVQRSLHHIANGFRIITVHMEYRRFHHFGNIGTVSSRPGITHIRSGKTNLVVDHHVDGTAGGITTGFRHIESRLVNTQANKS